ncbi:MAG: hypothetical protein KY464_01920 [Gemmatimonadetes bacterium]|nr:hypothetical protein [Gemmatimonadota bacterium]
MTCWEYQIVKFDVVGCGPEMLGGAPDALDGGRWELSSALEADRGHGRTAEIAAFLKRPR